jgi:hypothetical protein
MVESLVDARPIFRKLICFFGRVLVLQMQATANFHMGPPVRRNCASPCLNGTGAILRPTDRRYHCAMFYGIDPPDPDLVYRNYLETCKLLGIEPVPRDHAQALMVEWTGALAAARTPPPNTH